MNPDLLPQPRCPKCLDLIVSTVTRVERGIVTSDSICINGDPSSQKWLA